MRVEQDLDLDVARALEVALQDQPVVGEGRCASRRAAPSASVSSAALADHAHALPATAGAGLYEQRVADALGLATGSCRLCRAVVAGYDRDAVAAACRRAAALSPMAAIASAAARPRDPRSRPPPERTRRFRPGIRSPDGCVGPGRAPRPAEPRGRDKPTRGLIRSGRGAFVGRMDADNADAHARCACAPPGPRSHRGSR